MLIFFFKELFVKFLILSDYQHILLLWIEVCLGLLQNTNKNNYGPLNYLQFPGAICVFILHFLVHLLRYWQVSDVHRWLAGLIFMSGECWLAGWAAGSLSAYMISFQPSDSSITPTGIVFLSECLCFSSWSLTGKHLSQSDLWAFPALNTQHNLLSSFTYLFHAQISYFWCLVTFW